MLLGKLYRRYMVLSVLHGIIRTTFGYGQSENPKHIIETKQEPVLASQVWGKLTRLFIVIRRLRESDIAKIETNSRTKKKKQIGKQRRRDSETDQKRSH